ncbi:uncharacterized protein LOC121882147 isoform X1 [Scomber scombrus]|uniref:Uncharacterized protein LOC121882147 isoform X1 n=1 Tax=Scomber scombrus TaxID=13677 RepID=A0AAV1Q7K3_SCOSC
MKSTTMGKSTLEQDFPDWAKFTIVAVGIASLLIIVLVLIRFKKTKRNKTQMDENIADPEDGVSYAYVTFAKKNNCKARVRGGDAAVIYSTVKASSSSAGASTDPGNLYATVRGEDDDAVTYSTVKASSSSAGASTDPSNLYATVNKPKK